MSVRCWRATDSRGHFFSHTSVQKAIVLPFSTSHFNTQEIILELQTIPLQTFNAFGLRRSYHLPHILINIHPCFAIKALLVIFAWFKSTPPSFVCLHRLGWLIRWTFLFYSSPPQTQCLVSLSMSWITKVVSFVVYILKNKQCVQNWSRQCNSFS